MSGPSIRMMPDVTADWRAHCRDCGWISGTSRSRGSRTPDLATRSAARRHVEARGHRVRITWRAECEFRPASGGDGP